MTGVQAVCTLIIRLWAIGVVVGAMVLVAYVSMTISGGDATRDVLFSGVESAVWLGLGLCGWFLAPRLARQAVGDHTGETISLAISGIELVQVGSFLIGGYFVMERLPNFLSVLIFTITQVVNEARDGTWELPHFDYPRLAAEAVAFAVALFLAFKPREVANMFAALRVAGLSKVE